MHPETVRTLRIITEIEVEIDLNRKKLREIKKNCPHLDYKLDYVETMAFDQTPMRVCVVCEVYGDSPDEAEKRSLYIEYCDDLEIPFEEETFLKKKDGFNFC